MNFFNQDTYINYHLLKMRILITIGIVLFFSSCLCAGQADVKPFSSEFAVYNSTHFKINHQAETRDAENIAGLLELAYERFDAVFTNKGFILHTPNDKLEWICFAKPEHFNSYAMSADKRDLSWLSSYYSTKTNIVAIVKPDKIPAPQKTHLPDSGEPGSVLLAITMEQPSGDTVKLMHEAAHQLAFNRGLQKRNVMYPLWISEGLATSFEETLSSPRETKRNQRLVEMQKNNRLLPLDEFVTITRLPADAELQKDFYAQAYGLFQFASEHRKDSLKNYLAELYKLESGPRSKHTLGVEFVSAFGPVEQINQSWLDYVQGLCAAKQ